MQFIAIIASKIRVNNILICVIRKKLWKDNPIFVNDYFKKWIEKTALIYKLSTAAVEITVRNECEQYYSTS